jgi:hypothetical protein
MVKGRKERDGALEVADPDLAGSGIEIEGAFFVHLCCGVRRGKHLDTDFWCAGEDKGSLPELDSTLAEPSQVDGLNSVRCRERTLCQNASFRQEIFEEVGNVSLAIRMQKTPWGRHDDTAVSISLDSLRECGESRIRQDFLPSRKVEAALRL